MGTLFSGHYFLHELQSTATSTRQPFVAEYLRKECGDLNEAASDNDDVKDDDDANSKDVEVVEISTGETLAKLDRLVNLKYLSKEERDSLVAIQIRENKNAEQKAKPCQLLFYVRIKFVS